MDDSLVATGMAYELKECVVLRAVIPPLELADGRALKLKDAEVVWPPLRFLIKDGDTLIKASYDVVKAAWQIEKD